MSQLRLTEALYGLRTLAALDAVGGPNSRVFTFARGCSLPDCRHDSRTGESLVVVVSGREDLAFCAHADCFAAHVKALDEARLRRLVVPLPRPPDGIANITLADLHRHPRINEMMNRFERLRASVRLPFAAWAAAHVPMPLRLDLAVAEETLCGTAVPLSGFFQFVAHGTSLQGAPVVSLPPPFEGQHLLRVRRHDWQENNVFHRVLTLTVRPEANALLEELSKNVVPRLSLQQLRLQQWDALGETYPRGRAVVEWQRRVQQYIRDTLGHNHENTSPRVWPVSSVVRESANATSLLLHCNALPHGGEPVFVAHKTEVLRVRPQPGALVCQLATPELARAGGDGRDYVVLSRHDRERGAHVVEREYTA